MVDLKVNLTSKGLVPQFFSRYRMRGAVRRFEVELERKKTSIFIFGAVQEICNVQRGSRLSVAIQGSVMGGERGSKNFALRVTNFLNSSLRIL